MQKIIATVLAALLLLSATMKRAVQILVACLLLVSASGCGIVGPSCVSQKRQGDVMTVSGEVAAGQVMSHQVPYGTEGSQNNIRVTWIGQNTSNGPRIGVWATKVDCVDFTPPADSRASLPAAGACTSIGGGGGSLIITNGRGNPEQLGPNPQYKLWVVGDPGQSTTYFLSITWSRGPDC